MAETGEAVAGRAPIHRNGMAEALMLFTTFCWAGNIVAGKIALQAFSPLALAQVRMGAAAIIYIAVYIAWRGVPRLHLTRRQWLLLAVMAFTGITANQIFYIGGIAKTSVTHAGLIQAIGPIMVLLLAAAMGTEALTSRKIAGMAVSFTGVAILLVEKAPRGSGATWVGDVMLIIAAAVFSYYTILTKEVSDQYDSLTLNALVFGLGAIFLIPFCAVSVQRVRWDSIPLQAWMGLLFMVLFGSFVAYLIYAFALERLSASNVAAFAYLQPVMAALLGIWLLNERVSYQAVIGGALILGGVYLTERERGERKNIHHLARGRI